MHLSVDCRPPSCVVLAQYKGGTPKVPACYSPICSDAVSDIKHTLTLDLSSNMVLLTGVRVIHNRYFTAPQAPWEDSVSHLISGRALVPVFICTVLACSHSTENMVHRDLLASEAKTVDSGPPPRPRQLSWPPWPTNLLVPYFAESSCEHLRCSIISLNTPLMTTYLFSDTY